MLTDATIEKLKEANPGAELLQQRFEAIDADVVFKVPAEPEWRRFIIEASDGGAKRIGAVRVVVFNSVVFPDKDTFNELVARKPGIVSNIFIEISDAVGVNLESTVRKL